MRVLVFATAGILLVRHGVVAAQSNVTRDTTHGVWVAASLGAANGSQTTGGGDGVGTLAVDVQDGSRLYSARWHSIGLGVGSGGNALSLLVGTASTKNSFAFAGISAGLSANSYSECIGGCGLFADTPRTLGPTHLGAGVEIAGDAALRLGHTGGAGLGVTGFANVNTVHSFVGIGLDITIGRWR